MSSVTMSILLWANENNVFDGMNTNEILIQNKHITIFLWKQFGVDRKHEYQCIKSNKVIHVPYFSVTRYTSIKKKIGLITKNPVHSLFVNFQV